MKEKEKKRQINAQELNILGASISYEIKEIKKIKRQNKK